MKLFVLLSSLATLSFLVGATSHVDRIDHQETERDLSSFTGLVVSLELVNSTSDVKVATLTDGSIITTTNPTFSVNAIVEGKGTRCVVLKWVDSTNKTRTKYETTAPYSLCANNGLDFFSCDALGYGKHQFSVQACSKSDGRSSSCSTPMVIAIEIIKPPTQSPSSSPSTPPSDTPSVAPTVAPSSAPSEVCHATAIVFLNCNTLTKRTLSLTGTTQEDKAAQWVIQNNPTLLPDTEANRLSLLQRFALATMLRDGVGESSGSECSWIKVRCDVNNAVIALDWPFRGRALARALSKDLGLLSNLEYVDFSNDAQAGAIPSEWKAWTNIQTFDVRSNNLAGTIPTELGAWTKIKYFVVENNQLTGTIPTSLGNWINLQYLYLFCNNFASPQNISFVCVPSSSSPFVLVKGGLSCPCCTQYTAPC